MIKYNNKVYLTNTSNGFLTRRPFRKIITLLL